MTKIKLCGLTRMCDIEAVNELLPDYIGFVLAPQSRRYLTPARAAELKKSLVPEIRAVGVFVNENPRTIAALLTDGIIDIAQLHGNEDSEYIKTLRKLTDRPLLQAFRVRAAADVKRAMESTADGILLDAGAGTGTTFDWNLIRDMKRPYFLAGGLSPENVGLAVRQLRPYAVDVSSEIETAGYKDRRKMAAFLAAVRKEDRL